MSILRNQVFNRRKFLEFYDNMSILTDVCLGVVYDTPKTSFS